MSKKSPKDVTLLSLEALNADLQKLKSKVKKLKKKLKNKQTVERVFEG